MTKMSVYVFLLLLRVSCFSPGLRWISSTLMVLSAKMMLSKPSTSLPMKHSANLKTSKQTYKANTAAQHRLFFFLELPGIWIPHASTFPTRSESPDCKVVMSLGPETTRPLELIQLVSQKLWSKSTNDSIARYARFCAKLFNNPLHSALICSS